MRRSLYIAPSPDLDFPFLARRIPLPRLTRRQRTARWQRERRQQTVIVTAFTAILVFVVGLVAWTATDRFYQGNLKPAATIDSRAIPLRAYNKELTFEQTRFYVEFGVPKGFENDPQIFDQKRQYQGSSLEEIVQFAIFDAEARAQGIAIARSDIEARYAEDYGQFKTRHVLVTPDKDAQDKDAADRAALAKAQRIAQQLQTSPNDQDLWNKVAKESSDDPGSKDAGGELGWAGKGQFAKEYQDAVTTMQVGQVSDPVKTQFGYHVIQLEQRKGPDQNDIVVRWLGGGFTLDFIKGHARYGLLRDEFTKRAKDKSDGSPAEQVHLARIVVATPSAAGGDFQTFSEQLRKLSAVRDALDKGTDFAAVATQFSEDTDSKEKGGDVGWFARGMLDLRAEQEVFSKEVGKVTGSVAASAQTTFYKILERDPSRALTDDQKTQIKENSFSYWLAQQKKAHDVTKLVPGLEFQ